MDPDKGSPENVRHLDKKNYSNCIDAPLYSVKGKVGRGEHANIFPVGQKMIHENFLSPSHIPLKSHRNALARN